MSVASVGSGLGPVYPSQASQASTSGSGGDGFAAPGQAPSAGLLDPVPLGGLPTVQLTGSQLAAIQSGPPKGPADTGQIQAGFGASAYAVITSNQTGEVLGAVSADGAVIAASGVGFDPRLDGASADDQAQTLAQDIQQALGQSVSVQEFGAGDAGAPLFQDGLIGSTLT